VSVEVKNYAHWGIASIQGCWNFNLTLNYGEEMVVPLSYKMKYNVLGTKCEYMVLEIE